MGTKRRREASRRRFSCGKRGSAQGIFVAGVRGACHHITIKGEWLPSWGLLIKAREKFTYRLHQNPPRVPWSIHPCAEMPMVAGQQMGCRCLESGSEDRPIFLHQSQWANFGRLIGNHLQTSRQGVEPGKAVRIFASEISARLFNRQGTGQATPMALSSKLKQKGSLAIRIVGCRKQHVGIEKQSPHGCSARRRRISSRSPCAS